MESSWSARPDSARVISIWGGFTGSNEASGTFQQGTGEVVLLLADLKLTPGGIEPPVGAIDGGEYGHDLKTGAQTRALFLIAGDANGVFRYLLAGVTQQRLAE